MSDDTYNDDNVIVLPGMGGANNEGSAEGLEAATPVGPPAEHLMEAVVEALPSWADEGQGVPARASSSASSRRSRRVGSSDRSRRPKTSRKCGVVP